MKDNSDWFEESWPGGFRTLDEWFVQYRFCAAFPPWCAYSEAEWRSVQTDSRHWHRQMNPYPFRYFWTRHEAAPEYLICKPHLLQTAIAYCALLVHKKVMVPSRS